MKRLLGLLLLAALGYAAYTYYYQVKSKPQFTSDSIITSRALTFTQSSSNLADLKNVLGDNISRAVVNSQSYLADVTKGKSEPIINDLVNKTSQALKDLPQREADKIKYEFCKGVVTEYENKSTNH